MTAPRPRLIGVDWGTSRVRAYLIGDDGAVLDRRARPWGVMAAERPDFAAAFAALTGAWSAAQPGLPALAAGMIGSTVGWVAAPYRACPAGIGELAAGLVTVATGGAVVHVVPGVEQRGALPDVMRGEETQIAGALARDPGLRRSSTLVLPGTHTKWVRIDDGRITAFTTYMTGELYGLLADESILGRPARAAGTSAPDAARAAFERGVATARGAGSGGVMPRLFLVRSLVLSGALAAADSLEFLSGLLVGDEVRSGIAAAAEPLALLGDAGLCERYARALALFERTATAPVDDPAPAGLWEIARAADLVAPAGSALR